MTDKEFKALSFWALKIPHTTPYTINRNREGFAFFNFFLEKEEE